ncbi:MAG: CDP-alcohol phosphatidyltransferase family protein [Nitrospirota bacterium]|nr:CDP-alcohol phosphatidyltransferase family protein [Nitrospirota bacterium]
MATPASNPLTAGRSVADVHALDTAILLPTSSLFTDDQQSQSPNIDRIGPLTPVGGLPLFLRTVLTLQRAGIANLVILSGAEEESLKCLLTQDARIVAVVRWMPMREFPPDDPRTWEVLAQDIQGACLVIGAQTVFSPGLIVQLRHLVQAGSAQRVLVPTYGDDTPAGTESPEMMLVTADPLGRAAWRSVPGRHGTPLHLIKAHAEAEGRLEVMPIDVESSAWCRTLRTSAAVREAERRLLQSPKGSYDGVIDTYFNRKVANGFTRLFVKAGWSPNAITSLSILVGFLAAVLFAQGAYLAGVIGALLFQMSAIVDCCDGDVARLTFRESKFGARLDLIGDNVVHMAIFGALGWAGYANGGGWLFLALGLLAMIGNGLSLWWVARMKEWDARRGWTNPIHAARSEFIVKHMVSRDFSIVVLFFALVNLLGVFLWLAAIGSNLFWMMTAWVTRSPSLRA